MNPSSLKRISTWGKVLGIVMMICGALSALSGLFAFVVGAIPGLVTALMGYLLFKTGKDAQAFLESQSEEDLSNLIDGYAKYLFVNGIFMIVSVAVLVLVFMFFGAAMFAAFGGL